MEWIDLVGGAVTSAASGGVFGLIGSAIGGVFKFFQTKQQQRFEEKKWNHELKLIEKENERAREEDEHELSVVAQEGAWSGLGTSIEADAGIGDSYRWVKALKELYRPALTTGLVVISYMIFRDLMSIVTDQTSSLSRVFTAEQAKELIVYNVSSIVFSASTAVVWWFGDRAFAPPGMKNR